MWSYELEGSGRRAKVLAGVDSDGIRFALGDILAVEDSRGIITQLRTGLSDSLAPQAQLLEIREVNDEYMVTNRLVWINLNEEEGVHKIGSVKKAGSAQIEGRSERDEILLQRPIDKAVDVRRRSLDLIIELPSSIDLYDSQVLKYLEKLFSEQALQSRRSPRKSEALKKPQNQGTVSKANDRKLTKKVSSTRTAEKVKTPKEPGDEEYELLPSRKREEIMARNSLDQISDSLADILAKENSMKEYTELEEGTRNNHAIRDALKGEEDSQSDPGDSGDEGIYEEKGIPLQMTESRSKGHRKKKKVSLSHEVLLPIVEAPIWELSAVDAAISQLHPASDPLTHPCRESQFDAIFLALESAIAAETGTCVYVSGTPGTGKTSTIREVIGQLHLRAADGELPNFTYLEINGMKLTHPNTAYVHLWDALGRGQMAAANAMPALEAVFGHAEPRERRGTLVVLLDELDQLVSKGQQVMYNFFNWPSLPHSRLIVVAVANTMDLPERTLSNKISSRIGLTRVQFPGYTHGELLQIIMQRLEEAISTVNSDDVEASAGVGTDVTGVESLITGEALEYATRKVAGVGGDARRVLDFIRQAVERAYMRSELPARLAHVRDVIVEYQASPLAVYIETLGLATKVLLCALLARIRRNDTIEASLHEVLNLAGQLARQAVHADLLSRFLYLSSSQLPAYVDNGVPARLGHFQSGVTELIDAGIIVQQAMKGEATPIIRLIVPASTIREQLLLDDRLKGII